MKFSNFSHKTPHLKGKQHQLDPNLDLKQLVHHATIQYVDLDVDGDVDVYDNPKKKIPDENVSSAQKAQEYSNKLITKQKGEIKHTKRGMAYEDAVNEAKKGLRAWFGDSESKDGVRGWVEVISGEPCARQEGEEDETPKCVSSAKRASMTKSERISAQRRKSDADPHQPKKRNAALPTYVSTDSPTKKMKEEFFKENHKAIMSGREKDEEGYMASTEMDTIDSAVKKLRKIIKKGDSQLPAWVQSKITKAADYIDTAADYLDSNEMSEQSDAKGKGSGTKDACYHKVKSRYSVWPSAYASGALVKCRKVGADSWGNKSEEVEISLVEKILGEEMKSFKIDKTNHNDIKKQAKIHLASKTFPNDNEAKVAKSKLRPSAAVSLPLNNEYQPKLTELVLGEEKCGKGMYWCNTNKECKPLPKGFDVPGQKIKPTEVGIGKPVEGSCSKTKKGKDCPVHGMDIKKLE